MATLVYSDVDGADRSFALGAEPVLVGRGAECAIRSNDPRVSRTHARFFVEQGALWVEDLGSANGIYVGPQKVQRAPVPTGEIVLVGSLMIRLLPTSGTLPPPIGLHGTLAQWLEMERRARANLEEERDAFVKRVGELFDEIRTLREANGVGASDAEALRAELDQMRRESAAEVEIAKLDAAKAREARALTDTQAGIATAEKLAESDMTIASLQNQLAEARSALAEAASSGEARAAQDQLAAVQGRADKAEKELVTAQIRAQGAERNLAGANTQAAKAETRASELEHELAQKAEAHAGVEGELAKAKEKLAALETRLGAGDAPLQAAEDRAAKLASEQAALQARIAELEHAASAASSTAGAAEAKLSRAQSEGAAQIKKLDDAQARISELEERIRSTAGSEVEIAAARKSREDARETLATAEQRVADAAARAEDAEKRANAADTMAKAMAKDVAEALRRAADADVKTRAVTRDVDALTKRAETAEAKAALVDEAQAKVVASEKTAAERDQAATDKLAKAEKDLAEKAARIEQEISAKLQAAQRELAAERQTAMTLVDRKTQLERELADARTQLVAAQQQVEAATAKAAELEVQVEQLEERVQDLESGIAVEQTASASTLEETRARTVKLEEQLGEAKAAAKTALKTAAGLEKRIDGMENELKAARDAKADADAALAGVRTHVAELEKAADEHVGMREQVASAEQRVREAEGVLEPLQAKADAGDLAIGRASALQRQLDEALQKLSWLERDAADARTPPPVDDNRARDLEAKLQETESRVREAEDHARDADEHARAAEERGERLAGQAREAEAQARDAEARAQQAVQRSSEIEVRGREIEARAKDAAERIVDSERRSREAQHQLEQVTARLEEAEAQIAVAARTSASAGSNAGLERQLAAAQARIAELVREVDAAENVRQFAASTEREIAQLERELRENKAKVVQLTLERDKLASQLDDLHEDDETAHRRLPITTANDEPTTHADMARYSALVSRTTELEAKYGALEQEATVLRRSLAEAEARAEAQERAKEDEPTNTGNALPIEFAEHLSTLEEAIDSLRANMRAASDETAIMEQTDAVIAITMAVSQAAEHVERGRDAIKTLSKLIKGTVGT
jgi:chromosome segregation ATPase